MIRLETLPPSSSVRRSHILARHLLLWMHIIAVRCRRVLRITAAWMMHAHARSCGALHNSPDAYVDVALLWSGVSTPLRDIC